MTKNKQIYVSYAWNVEDQNKIVDKLEQASLQRGFTLLRDKKQIDYKGSIRKFMNDLAAGDAIILVLSDAYFKSRFCTYELCNVYKRDDFISCVFPIVVSGTSFTDIEDREPYIDYWAQKVADKRKVWDKKPTKMSSKSHTELKECEEVCREIDELLAVLADMNNLTENIHVDSNFEALFNQIQPAQQKDDTSKPKRERLSDQKFRLKIVENIQSILEQQTNLFDELKITVNEDNIELESLVNLLCKEEFETAIDDRLYPATKQCLSELDSNSSSYSELWEAAKTILSWLSLLVVRNEWVDDQEKLIGADDLSFTVQVKTATGIEVASARFRQLQPKLEAMTGRAEVVGQGGILPPQFNPGWGKDVPLQRILIEIWNKVFPEDTRQPSDDHLSDDELGNLDYALATREKRKTHHYYIPVPKDRNIATDILKHLHSITIIYLTSSATKPTLRVENEGRFTSVIREFLTMNDN